MPKCFQLIGVPAAGKTTWVSKQPWAKNCVYASSDKWIELFAQELNLTYSEAFDTCIDHAIELMAKEVKRARAAGKDIIWDQTNLTVKSRARKFRMLPDYEHIAVVFETPNELEHTKRLQSRPGKTISADVIEHMKSSIEAPSLEEGFSQIFNGKEPIEL